MKVKELIEILQELPKEANVNFKVGDGEMDAYRHAKVQLWAGETLSLMAITEVQMHRYVYDEPGPDDDIIVDISLHDCGYTYEGFIKMEKCFDEATKGVDFKAAVHGDDKY